MPCNGFVMPEKLLYDDPVLAKKIVRAIVKEVPPDPRRRVRVLPSATMRLIGLRERYTAAEGACNRSPNRLPLACWTTLTNFSANRAASIN